MVTIGEAAQRLYDALQPQLLQKRGGSGDIEVQLATMQPEVQRDIVS